MELRFSHLADFATVDASSKPTIVGIFDRVMCQPNQSPIPFPGFHLVASFEASISEGAEHELEIAFINEDEETQRTSCERSDLSLRPMVAQVIVSGERCRQPGTA